MKTTSPPSDPSIFVFATYPGRSARSYVFTLSGDPPPIGSKVEVDGPTGKPVLVTVTGISRFRPPATQGKTLKPCRRI